MLLSPIIELEARKAGRLTKRRGVMIGWVVAAAAVFWLAVTPIAALAGNPLGGGLLAIAVGNSFLAGCAAGILGSAICEQRKAALSLATLILIAVCLVAPVLGFFIGRIGGQWAYYASQSLIGVCPFLGYPSPTFGGPGPTTLGWSSWQPLLASQLSSWAMLWLAGRFIKRHCDSRSTTGFRMTLRERWRNIRRGGFKVRTRRRQRFLSENPFYWLISRERGQRFSVWLPQVLCVGIVAAIWIAFLPPGIGWVIPSLCVLYLLHLLLKYQFASAASAWLFEEKRAGGLETVLATPLSEREIADGQWMALRRLFRLPLVLLVILSFVPAGWALAFGFGLDDPGAIDWELRWFVAGCFLMLLVWLPLDLLAAGWAGMLGGLKEPDPRKARRYRMDASLMASWLLGAAIFAVVAIYVPGSLSILSLNHVTWAMFGLLAGSGVFVALTQRFWLKREVLRSMRRLASNV
ncbi:MAG: hypothetical protein ACI8QF_002583 [Limisphaerales bacterium]|jgi:hypothetical protein